MYEVYQDHPKQAKLNVRVVLAIAFLICAIGAGIFLITRLVGKPLTKEDARGQTGIVYDSSAVEGGWDNLSPEEIAEKLNEKVAEGMITESVQKLGRSVHRLWNCNDAGDHPDHLPHHEKGLYLVLRL